MSFLEFKFCFSKSILSEPFVSVETLKEGSEDFRAAFIYVDKSLITFVR